MREERPSTRRTAAQIRGALRATFPRTRISVTVAPGVDGVWVDARWTDGPTAAAVEAAVGPFRSSCAGFLTHREYSRRARDWARAAVAAEPSRHEAPSDWHVNGHNYGAEHRLLDARDLTTVPPAQPAPGVGGA